MPTSRSTNGFTCRSISSLAAATSPAPVVTVLAAASHSAWCGCCLAAMASVALTLASTARHSASRSVATASAAARTAAATEVAAWQLRDTKSWADAPPRPDHAAANWATTSVCMRTASSAADAAARRTP